MLQVSEKIVQGKPPFRCGCGVVFFYGNTLRRKRNRCVTQRVKFERLPIIYDVHVHRALKDVSIALLATCFPFPSLSFALFYINECGCDISVRSNLYTEKSAALSFRFFALLGIMA